MRYRDKKDPSNVFEAITFDELTEAGLLTGAEVVDGMPKSFEHWGSVITSESKERYLVTTERGTIRMDRGEFLLRGADGSLSLYELHPFLRNHEVVE